MNIRKDLFWWVMWLVFMFISWCSFSAEQQVEQESKIQSTWTQVQAFDLNAHFTMKASPDKNSEACIEAIALDLTFESKEYGQFKITLPDMIYDYCDETVRLQDIVGKAYQLGDVIYFPVALARGSTVLDTATYKYHLKNHQLEKMDKSCLMLDDSQLLKNGIIKGMLRRIDYDSLWWKQERNEEVYCDLIQYLRYNAADYALAQNVSSSSQWVQNEEEKDKAFISQYYRLLENHQFDELFALSLRKGVVKDKNPFYDWYKEVKKAEVVSILPQWDRTYEVKTKLIFPVYEITTSWPQEISEEANEYLALKKVVEKDWKRYLDGLDSKDITPKWNCKKNILKQRTKKCTYETFFEETSALESSLSSNLSAIGIKQLDGHSMFQYNAKNSGDWGMLLKFWKDKILKRLNCNDGIGCTTADFSINGGKAFAYNLDPKSFYGDEKWKLYNLVYSWYVDELSEIGFDEEHDQKVLSKYCAKNPQLKLSLYKCEQE